MIIVVDSDGLIGMLHDKDAHHKTATTILEHLRGKDITFLYPATVIAEATAILQVRLKKPDLAIQITELLTKGNLLIEPVDDALLKTAASFLKPGMRKHNTLFDAIVAATAEKVEADAIFSFDQWYEKLGFTLTEDFLK